MDNSISLTTLPSLNPSKLGWRDSDVSVPHHNWVTSGEQQPFISSVERLANPRLGEPSAKPLLSVSHTAACCVSVLCSVVAVVCVADQQISWYLGIGNRQLIVLGFLLSIMNLCLGTVSPFLLLLLEARFGKSTLQNYSGLLRNQISRRQLAFYWRGVLFVLLALPIGLSAAYKSFDGGSSSKSLNSTSFLTKQPYYGMFAPPGIQQMDVTGLTLLTNATLPYFLATSPTAQNISEPPLPVGSQAYGFNVLMISENATAYLDIPEPSYITQVQARLAIGESWDTSAAVYGTVATYDESRTPNSNLTYFETMCEGINNEWDWGALDLFIGWSIHFMVPFTTNNSLQYLAITPASIKVSDCDQAAQYFQPFQVTRQSCRAIWTITRGGVELKTGSCSGLPAEPQDELQTIINKNYLVLPYWYMSPLADALGRFIEHTGSPWRRPRMAASVAGIFWSRVVALLGAAKMYNSSSTLGPYVDKQEAVYQGESLTWRQVGMLYPVDDTVTYIRPTLRKSIWLYVVLTIQPVLTILMVLVATLLHSTPIGQDFGLISVLSGIDPSCLDVMTGAGLSGNLSKDITLAIQPTVSGSDGGAKQKLSYRLSPSLRKTKGNGRVERRAVYE